MTHILITDLREIRYITGKIESVPLDPEKDTLPFDREEDLREIETVMYTKWMSDHNYKAPFPLWKKIELKPGIYQVPVEVEIRNLGGNCPRWDKIACSCKEICDVKKVARLKSSEPKEESQDDEAFLLHLIDVVACFVMEQNMFLATPTRKELIEKARSTFSPLQGKEVNQ